MRDRLQETHGPRFELLRHFLTRSFDSDIFSTPGQRRRVAVSAIALALPAGMLLMDPPYYHQPIDPSPATLCAVAIAGELAVLTLLTAVAGGLALLLWESLFPSRLDYHALAGLPLHPRKIFVTRFLAVLCMASAVTVAMGMLPAVMLPHQFTANGGPELENWRARLPAGCHRCSSSLPRLRFKEP